MHLPMVLLWCRHDVHIAQQGSATETYMKHFLLCGENQLHDLHTKLLLDHPDGIAQQLHKCIVAEPSGRGVFDGTASPRRPTLAS
jgi:Fe-S cluster assembly protein SufD